MALTPAVTGIDALKDRPELARLLTVNAAAVSDARFDHDELTIWVDRAFIRTSGRADIVAGREARLKILDYALFLITMLAVASAACAQERVDASKLEGKVLFEHTHRVYAFFVGNVTILNLVLVWRAKRAGHPARALAVAALGTVIVQGVLSGITVIRRMSRSIAELRPR